MYNRKWKEGSNCQDGIKYMPLVTAKVNIHLTKKDKTLTGKRISNRDNQFREAHFLTGVEFAASLNHMNIARWPYE